MGRIWGILAVGTVIALSGCTAAPAAVAQDEMTTLLTSDVDPSSSPAFLETAQQPRDILPPEAQSLPVQPDSTRYQGEWNGQTIYLSVNGANSVYIISNDPDHPNNWGAGGSIGNTATGSSGWSGDEIELVYLPQGSANPPDGWVAFGDYMIQRR